MYKIARRNTQNKDHTNINNPSIMPRQLFCPGIQVAVVIFKMAFCSVNSKNIVLMRILGLVHQRRLNATIGTEGNPKLHSNEHELYYIG